MVSCFSGLCRRTWHTWFRRMTPTVVGGGSISRSHMRRSRTFRRQLNTRDRSTPFCRLPQDTILQQCLGKVNQPLSPFERVMAPPTFGAFEPHFVQKCHLPPRPPNPPPPPPLPAQPNLPPPRLDRKVRLPIPLLHGPSPRDPRRDPEARRHPPAHRGHEQLPPGQMQTAPMEF